MSEPNILINDVVVAERLRKDMGDIAELTASIQEHGLIQPVVLTRVDGHVELSAGGRRLAALKQLKLAELVHGVHFVWLDERNADAYARKAVELEENIKRKQLSWTEEVSAKQQLLELMQLRYGAAKSGAPTLAARADTNAGIVSSASGFGVNKLAAMIGESAGQTSKDLTIARALAVVPALAKANTKEAAFRMLQIASKLITMRKSAPATPSYAQRWTLYEGDFRANASKLADASVDLVFTDLPWNKLNAANSPKGGLYQARELNYGDDMNAELLQAVCSESYRVLHDDRYAVFMFGFSFYQDLVEALQAAGFAVDIVPAIWLRGMMGNPNPNIRYSINYDPLLVARKGSPSLVHQGASNVFDIPPLARGAQLRISEKPPALLSRIMSDMITQNALVVDWMAGAGSTGEAALKFGARVALFEIDPAACSIIRTKLGAL